MKNIFIRSSYLILSILLLSSCIVERYNKPSLSNLAYKPTCSISYSLYENSLYINSAIYANMWMQAESEQERIDIEASYFKEFEVKQSGDTIFIDKIISYKTYGKPLDESDNWDIILHKDGYKETRNVKYSLSYNKESAEYSLNAINSDSDYIDCNLIYTLATITSDSDKLIKYVSVKGVGSTNNLYNNSNYYYKYNLRDGLSFTLEMNHNYYTNLFSHDVECQSGSLEFQWYTLDGEYMTDYDTLVHFNTGSATIIFMSEQNYYPIIYIRPF